MNYETFKEKMADFEFEIKAIKVSMKQLTDDYLSTSPLQKGDKVLVTHDGMGAAKKQTYAFIGNVLPPYSFQKKEGFRYELLGCKKDGTASLNSAGIYSWHSIEKATT